MNFPLPEIGEGVYEAEAVRWLVQPGGTVKRGQGLLEVMTDKATMEVPSPFAGTVTALHANPGEKVRVGQVVLEYTPAGEAAAQESGVRGQEPAARAKAAAPAPERGGNGHGGGSPALTPASPSVRHMARKLGVDLARVRGSGPAGRVLLDDLTAYLQPAARAGTDQPPPGTPTGDPMKAAYGTAGTRIPMVGLRRKIAEHLVHSKHTAPHYSYVDECDLSSLVRLRQELREPFARNGVKLTYLAFFVKAAAYALREIPIVNASLDDAKGEILLHDRYHVGVAVATPAGLVVPVVRDADRKDVATIAEDVERLSKEARAGKSRLDDLRGGTFTITSIGSIGGLISTPIINHPEAAILGVGKVSRRPVFDASGAVRAAELVYLSFSFDHRVVDGAVGAAFGNAFVRHVTHPATLLLPEKFHA